MAELEVTTETKVKVTGVTLTLSLDEVKALRGVILPSGEQIDERIHVLRSGNPLIYGIIDALDRSELKD